MQLSGVRYLVNKHPYASAIIFITSLTFWQFVALFGYWIFKNVIQERRKKEYLKLTRTERAKDKSKWIMPSSCKAEISINDIIINKKEEGMVKKLLKNIPQVTIERRK